MSSQNEEIQLTQFPILVPTVQIAFYKRLVNAQSEYLLPALLKQISILNLEQIDQELYQIAGEEKLRYIASYGIRGELLFPTPLVLSAQPSLIAYYRLLLGFSQKEFYRPPFSQFSNMESQGSLTKRTGTLLLPLCYSLTGSAWILVNGIPDLSREIFNALTLLTLGSQFRGSYNTLLGQGATKQVFELIKEIVMTSILTEDNTSITVRNAAGRNVRIEFAPDPNIAIREQLSSGRFNNRIAIEIKGGRDISNIHNRLGEAEKSHQNAREQGFTQFWTMVNVPRLNIEVARRESPTTTAFFVIDQIVDRRSLEFSEFRELLLAELGLEAQ